MFKLIIIGLLKLLRGNTCLLLNGVSDIVTSQLKVVDTLNGTHTVCVNYGGDYSKDEVVVGSDVDNLGFQLRFDFGPNTWLFQYRISGNYYYLLGNSTVVGEEVELSLVINGSDIELLQDGISVDSATNFTGEDISPTSNISVGGGDLSRHLTGCVSYYKYDDISLGNVINWDMTNQFDNTSVIDSSGNGYDGTRTGTTWWKSVNGKPADENYLTRVEYTGTWPLPMEASHSVIVVDPSQYEPTANVVWSPYNVDLTYDFNVSLQQLRHALPGADMRLNLNLHLNL